MDKKKLIEDIINQLEGCNVDVKDLLINNSNGDNMEVVCVGYQYDVPGIFMANGDFCPLEELSYDECEMIFDYLFETC